MPPTPTPYVPPDLPTQPGDPPAPCTPDGLQLVNVYTMALDDTHVFLGDSGTGMQDGAIVRVDRVCEQADILAAGLPTPRQVAVHGDHVYWSDDDALWRAAKDGSGRVELSGIGSGAIAFDDDHLYYANTANLQRIALGGGEPEVLASFYCGIHSVALDDTHAYVAQANCDGDIWRVSKADATVERIATYQRSRSIAVDATHVYWILSGPDAVTLWPKSGGDARIMPDFAPWGRLVQTQDRIYFRMLDDIGSYLKAGSELWRSPVPATAIAIAEERIYRANGGLLGAFAHPAPEDPTGFPSGPGSLTVSWTANCGPDSLIALYLDGPAGWVTSVDCNAGGHTFGQLPVGSYGLVVHHPYQNVHDNVSNIEVGDSETVIGPLDLIP